MKRFSEDDVKPPRRAEEQVIRSELREEVVEADATEDESIVGRGNNDQQLHRGEPVESLIVLEAALGDRRLRRVSE